MQINQLVEFIRDYYQSTDFIPLHTPVFKGNEKQYVAETIDSTFVSSVGAFVDRFENSIAGFTHSQGGAVATVNGTAALHAALFAAGVSHGDVVITQALTFVATGNAILQLGAEPVFVDVSEKSLGLCPEALSEFLSESAALDGEGVCRLHDGRAVKAVVPMHTFGHPVEIDELLHVCNKWHLTVIEDAAESLGSLYKGQHTGCFGDYGILSFNGNKVITTGGGGMVLCKDKAKQKHLKHITTTAKQPHAYEFFHDQPGFNYRMPNLNAALGVAQMESLQDTLQRKRALADLYYSFFTDTQYRFVREPGYAKSNYWLNAVLCENKQHRDELLEATNQCGVMTRPVWTLLSELPMFNHCLKADLSTSNFLVERLVNLPSTPWVE